MIVTKRISSTIDVRVCDRCKLDPNPAPVQSLAARVTKRDTVVGTTGNVAKADLCEDCMLILFQQIGVALPPADVTVTDVVVAPITRTP